MRGSVPILLVEDDKIDVQNVKRAFQKNKIANPLYVANNGEEALALLRERLDENRPEMILPGIILLDINMPVMNGIEFLEEIKADEKLRSIPVIVLTTSKEESDRVDSFDLGVAGYIVKPVDFYKFVEAIGVINLYWSLSELPSERG